MYRATELGTNPKLRVSDVHSIYIRYVCYVIVIVCMSRTEKSRIKYTQTYLFIIYFPWRLQFLS